MASLPLPLPASLIVPLLKEELKNQKLTGGLAELGILAEAYHSNLAGVILTLMGFDLSSEAGEELYAFYDERLTALATLEISLFQEQLDALAKGFYQELQARKNESYLS